MGATLAIENGQTPIRVLQSLRQQADDNPYVKQVVAAVSAYVDVEFFSWRRALFGRYDVFHVHWPEFLLRAPERSRPLQYGLFLALLARMVLSRRPVVRTLHNIEPHEGANRIERFLLGLLDRHTRMWIRLNAVTADRAPHTVTILHGHYRDWFAHLPVPETVPGRLLYFGLIRPYKGVETLIDSFLRLDPALAPDAELRIVGHASTRGLRRRITDACNSDPRIGALLHYVDDPTLATEIGQAELVVLPFRRMLNSGSLLLALSLDRPVLVPRNEANEALAEEVGPGWVYMYDGDLDRDVLLGALWQVRNTGRARTPDFSRREWDDAGDRHYRAYVAALRGEPVEG
ncbi:GDP-mannose--glycolipid 4-beta-D-mannosyltransferase [Aromatoleum toluvorans]|uniref:GDP-mannose--glycolipid 4-beta-D-mannosyltransferase n=1 Tax=Aromatoleum toluvorans TaxID=92002 RepID=A0ABX1Q401_9RHOO|nr:GDP-mannose--glycolipid 4-beta-D-mannosyltransferase [Aromatoleum toluvorans]NMG46088.1 GDP-mannose--glycolipid 4-beta-D-mannosyltransferase [Aromatoleum toluvorans]